MPPGEILAIEQGNPIPLFRVGRLVQGDRRADKYNYQETSSHGVTFRLWSWVRDKSALLRTRIFSASLGFHSPALSAGRCSLDCFQCDALLLAISDIGHV